MRRHGGCRYRSHMSQLRLAALVTLLAAGCYSEAAPQSTLPEPQYVAGPPGGAIDPGSGYADATDGSGANVGPGIAATDPADPADDDDRDDDTDPAANGAFDPARDPSIGAPSAAPGAPAPNPDDVAQLDGAARFGTTSDPGDPTASVSDEEIDATLDGYGEWVQTDDYGQVWGPDATVVGVDFTPYESGGSWTYTDAGWAFACDYPWGWLPFHYRRWGWVDGFWGWAPDYSSGPRSCPPAAVRLALAVCRDVGLLAASRSLASVRQRRRGAAHDVGRRGATDPRPHPGARSRSDEEPVRGCRSVRATGHAQQRPWPRSE